MRSPSSHKIPSVLVPNGAPGAPWASDLQAPRGDGTNVSIPPMFGGNGPGVEITGVDTPKLGLGTANPAFHGGG